MPWCGIRTGLGLLLALSLAPAVRGTALEVYGRLPHLEHVALSPDGSRIAFVKTEEDTRVVAVIAVANRQMIGGLRLGEEKVRFIEWADDDHLLVATSVTAVPVGFWGDPSEWLQMQVFDVATRRSVSIPDTDRSTGDAVNDVQVQNLIFGRVMVRRAQDRTLLFVPGLQITSGEPAPALFRVDLKTRDSRILRVAKPATERWLVDGAGEVAAEMSYDDDKQLWSIAIRRDGRLQEVASGHESIEHPKLLGFGPRPDTLLIRTREADGWVWRLLSLKDGTLGEPMAGSQTLSAPLEDRTTYRIVGGVRLDDTAHYVFFDPDIQQRWDAILHAFPGEHVSLESAAADYRRVIVLVAGARHGLRYMLVDLDAHRAESLGEVYEGLKEPLEVRRITYAAADGLEIPAYLTLPRDRPPKRLPLIVLPHGGPAASDTGANFDWWSQALADQGYAVLQPNFRGSSLGWKFMSAGFGEWGRKMQTDLSDGVRYLAKEGVIDPARVCIVGASYGGYAALAGPTLDPGVYRCAVSVAGLSDLKRMLTAISLQNRTRRKHDLEQRYWERFMGVSGADDAALDAISPIRHVSAVTVPILLIHGKDDTVVPYEQSQVMHDALRSANKDVQLVTLKREDHWLSRGATRLQMLEASVAFLRAHNPPEP